MKSRGHIAFLLAIVMIAGSLFASLTVHSQDQEHKEHTVSRGETLWTISSKEIVDPFLWPKIWKENPEIKNPDLIYPGQKIRIPLYLIQKEVTPQPRGEAMPEAKPEAKPEIKTAEEPSPKKIVPVTKDYLVDMDTLISSGYIAESVESRGEIIGAPTERAYFGRGDYAYIKTSEPSVTGDRFYIIRSTGRVNHPETGAMLGYLIDVAGTAEVIGKESGQTKVRITASFSEVQVGDLLEIYYEMEQPFLTDKPRTITLSGFIVATKQRRLTNAQYSIVFIDKGKRDGLEVGDMIDITATNRYSIPNGLIQVIAAHEKTATAVVRRSEKEVQVGDKIGAL